MSGDVIAEPSFDLSKSAVEPDRIKAQVALVRKALGLMQRNVHYGKVPGAKRDALWQPGADFLNLMFQIRIENEVVSSTRREDFIAFTVKARAFHRPTGVLLAEGFGTANSREEQYVSTLATRNGRKKGAPITVWEIEHPILRKAEKRALCNVTVRATAAGEVFEDVDDAASGSRGQKPEPDGASDLEEDIDRRFEGGGGRQGASRGRATKASKRGKGTQEKGNGAPSRAQERQALVERVDWLLDCLEGEGYTQKRPDPSRTSTVQFAELEESLRQRVAELIGPHAVP